MQSLDPNAPPSELLEPWKNLDMDLARKKLHSQAHKYLDHNTWIRAHWYRAVHCIPDLLGMPKVDPPARFLDIGCGNGALQEIMRYCGWQTRGFDWYSASHPAVPSGLIEDRWSEGYKLCIESQGLNSYHHSILDWPYPEPDMHYDLVSAIWVLQFIGYHRVHEFLNELARISRNTIWVATVTNPASSHQILMTWRHPQFELARQTPITAVCPMKLDYCYRWNRKEQH